MKITLNKTTSLDENEKNALLYLGALGYLVVIGALVLFLNF